MLGVADFKELELDLGEGGVICESPLVSQTLSKLRK